MDKWNCPHCSEELLGAANRCWKCGQRVKRPKPVEIIIAEVMPEPVLVAVAEPLRLTADDVDQAICKEPPRRGSPFAVEVANVPGVQKPFYGEGPYARVVEPKNNDEPLLPRYHNDQVATTAAIIGLILGGLSLIIVWFTFFAGIIAGLGLVLSMCGLQSKNRPVAILGILISSFVLGLTFFFIMLAIVNVFLLNAAGAPPPSVL